MSEIKKRVRIFHLLKYNKAVIFSWVIFTLIAILFQKKISIFLANNSLLTDREVLNGYFNSAYLFIVAIIIIRFFWFILKNYRLSKKQNYFIFFITALYIVLRYDSDSILRFSSYNDNFYYADLTILTTCLAIILLYRNVFGGNLKWYDTINSWFQDFLPAKKSNKPSYLIQDTPQDEILENDNEIIINEIVTALDNLKPRNSFIIGINSIWGIGKTSFLKRLEYKLKRQASNETKPITFWFNAWQHQDEKSIINNFFNQLKKELSAFSGDSKNSIDNYLKEMLALVDDKYFKFFNSITENFFASNDTIKDYYNDINCIIEKIDRKIIVFVDDIDRLNKTEILETLRVLRNIADFKNMIFICGFDREYVIKQSQIDNYFLDKIFNLEISLTTHNQRSLVNYLNDLIEESLGYNTAEKEFLIKGINDIFNNDDDDFAASINLELFTASTEKEVLEENLTQTSLVPSFFFESRRDVKKFFNELYINIKTLKNIQDINADDYLILKLLFFKYKWMYKNFSAKRMPAWLGKEVTLKYEKSDLKNLHINSEIDNQDKVVIYSILKYLFPASGVDDGSKGINQKRYFPIYFNNNVFGESFSFSELIKAIEKNGIQNLITNKVIGKENENLIKSDIKKFILRPENIRTNTEYRQVVDLIKEDKLGYVTEVEVLDFILLGEMNFKEYYESILKTTILNNINDSFGSFMYELNLYYSKIPNDLSLGREDHFGSHVNSKKIESFTILNKNLLHEILLDLVIKEIENNKKDVKKVIRYTNLFYEFTYPLYSFKLVYDDFKKVMIQYFTEEFESAFLTESARDTLVYLDFPFIASIFEDVEKRVEITTLIDDMLVNRTQWSSSDLDPREYISKGLDNFIEFVENLKELISPEKLESYSSFLNLLHTYQDKKYISIPTEEDVVSYLERHNSE